jgi:hypothetical protein
MVQGSAVLGSTVEDFSNKLVNHDPLNHAINLRLAAAAANY